MEEVEVRHRQLSEELGRLELLVEAHGWIRLMEIADGQILNRMPAVMTPLVDLFKVGEQEFEKGEINGIKLFCELPHKRIADLKATLDEMEKEDDYREPSPVAGGESRDAGDDFEPPAP